MNVFKFAKGIRQTRFSLTILFYGIFLSAQIFPIAGNAEDPFINFSVQATSISSSEINLHLTTSVSGFPLSSGWIAEIVLYKNLFCGQNQEANLSFEPGIQVLEEQISSEGEIILIIQKMWSVNIQSTDIIVVSDISTKIMYAVDYQPTNTDNYAAALVIEPVYVNVIAPEPVSVDFYEYYATPLVYGERICGIRHVPLDYRSGGRKSNNNSFLPPPTTTVIYPTPASNYLKIDVATDENVDLRVLDISGYELLSQQNVSANGYQLDLSQLSSGIYFLNIQSQNKQVGFQKFIVQK